MCPPEYFTVKYAINPWMNPDHPVDLTLAKRQWEQLRATYLSLGHTVRIIDPEPGLPDMVFAANGATVIGGNVLGSRFKHPERHQEGAAYMNWFRRSGYQVVEPGARERGRGRHRATPVGDHRRLRVPQRRGRQRRGRRRCSACR